MSYRKNQVGFTLFEIAIVLVIVGLLLSGGLNLMSASTDSARYKETQNDMQDVKDALMTFYAQYQFLPCPDIDINPASNSFGVSDYGGGVTVPPIPSTGGVCTNNEGYLPHVTLGIGGNGDAWGGRIKYVINGAFNNANNATNFCTTALGTTPYSRDTTKTATQVQVQGLTPASPAVGQVLGDWAGFALLSTGKNGLETNAGMTGAFTGDGGCATLAATNVNEKANCTASNAPMVLRSGTQMSDGNTIVFDDTVVWVGDMQLVSLYRQSGACLSASTTPVTPPIDPTSPIANALVAANANQTVSGNYNNNTTPIPVSNGDDKAAITGNMNQSLDLQNGNNTLDVSGNANGNISAGTGNDVVRVQGNLTQAVSLGDGNDYLEVQGNTSGGGSIDMGTGNDSVRIVGNVGATVALGTGTNSIYVGGNINSLITATGGSAIVYYDHATMSPATKLFVSGLTTECRANSSSPWVSC